MLPKASIQGIKIASGRATWKYKEDSDNGYYNFAADDSFSWKVTPQQLQELEVDEQDLLDCIAQAEAQFGSPEKTQKVLGMFPGAGVTHVGATYISRTNPKITCVFTPTSENFPTCKGLPITMDWVPTDAYFEWYYNEAPVNLKGGLEKFMADYDRLTGARASNTASSPIMVPTYEEACVFTSGWMGESVRERFLQQVWNFHRFKQPMHHRERLQGEILESWQRVKRVRALVEQGE